ncbi:hypothetical protein N0V90_007473 [Kalmusia sp. IMI 367209]|nr:hypothetical protein N0V90_007473 [Kalmusia sp. IMI 367209]
MNGSNRDDPPAAQRTCAQCKSSKKKCDKLLPKCSRCLRLAIECSYTDPERLNGSEAGNDAADSRFEEVFERLKRIEAHVFPSEPVAQIESEREKSLMSLAQSHGIENPNPTNWTLEPGTLKPQYMSLILWQSILATLDEHRTTVQAITRIYITKTDQWLPMVSSTRYQKELDVFGSLMSSDRFVLLVLAMHLVVSPSTDHPPAASLAESPWYRKCKYHFSQYVAFKEPNVELIQAGMLISLFEFDQCIEDRALATLGICCRLAYLLDFDEVMAKHASQDLGKLSPEDEEIILTWMGLTRLERYFNMPPTIVPKAPCPPISNFSTLDLEALSSCIYDAAIHIQCFFVAKQGTLDPQTMRSLHSYIEQLRVVINRCRAFHGFEDNYLDGIQPTWCSLPYYAIRAYRLIEEADCEHTLPKIDMMLFVETLQIMAPKYKLAAHSQERGSSVIEIEAEIVQAQQPLSAQDQKDEKIAVEEAEAKPGLPFSKARAIALVITVTAASFLNLLWGRLADVYGKKIIFVWGSIWITVTSVIVPAIPNEIGFDIFRGLQGLGAAAMVPTAIGILGTTFPPGKAKNYAFSCYGGGAPLGGVFGNIFGGVLGQYLEWRWVFWIFGILTAIVTVAAIYVIPPPPVKREPQLSKAVDWFGGTIVTVGLIILLFALSEGNVVGWGTPWVGTLIGVSILLLVGFGFWQHYLEKHTDRRPLMKISIFKNVRFTAANIIMLLFFTSFNNFLIYATYWFQDYQGLSVIQTTLRFIPTGVTGVLVAIVTSQLLSRVRGDFILAFGTTSVSLASLLFAIPISDHTTYWAYGFPAMVLSVFGADTLFPTLTLFVAKSLPSEDQALGGALVNMVGQFGRALGLAIATALQTAVMAKQRGVSVDKIGSGDGSGGGKTWDPALKVGIRSAAWFDFGMGIVALGVVLIFFRGAGKVGGKH